jgi:hypothetical protein
MAKAEKGPLWQALDHAMIASTGTANFAPYCHFQPGGWLVGYDGMIAAGSKVAEQLTVAPHTETFRNAVARAGNPYSITVKNDGGIVVSGDKVRAPVPCFPLTAIPNVMPDAPLGPFQATAAQAVWMAGRIAATRADSVVASSVMLKRDSAVATDGSTIVEAHHGGGLPTSILLPVEFANALGKAKRPATHCGFNDATFTAWLGPEQWLRTNLYEATYPDTDLYFARIRSQCGELRPVPQALLQAVETLKPFREGALMHIFDKGLSTGPDGAGAVFHFEHYMAYRGPFPTEGLRMAATYGEWIAFGNEGAFWYGQVCRGITALGAGNV